jgi:hypothetical protein
MERQIKIIVATVFAVFFRAVENAIWVCTGHPNPNPNPRPNPNFNPNPNFFTNRLNPNPKAGGKSVG